VVSYQACNSKGMRRTSTKGSHSLEVAQLKLPGTQIKGLIAAALLLLLMLLLLLLLEMVLLASRQALGLQGIQSHRPSRHLRCCDSRCHSQEEHRNGELPG